MDRQHLEQIRTKAEHLIGSYFDATRRVAGPVGIPSLAQGVLDAVSAELRKEFGDKVAYEIFATCADRIVDQGAAARCYMSAIAADIEAAAKRAKP